MIGLALVVLVGSSASAARASEAGQGRQADRLIAGESAPPRPPIPQSGSRPPPALQIAPGAGGVLEIPLPERFRGCWEGQVAELDTRRKLGGFWPAWCLKWLPKNYEICFVQRGLGAWELGSVLI
jgi:hypothetical protein